MLWGRARGLSIECYATQVEVVMHKLFARRQHFHVVEGPVAEILAPIPIRFAFSNQPNLRLTSTFTEFVWHLIFRYIRTTAQVLGALS